MTAETLLDRLEHVRRSGDGWTARCPAHDDRNASLSVGVGDDGRTLVCCHAGCTVDAVVAAADLDVRDLFDPDSSRFATHTRQTRSAPFPVADEHVRELHRALLQNAAAVARLEELRGWRWTALAHAGVGVENGRVVFPYRDAAGALVGIARYAPDPATRNGSPKMKADTGSRRDLLPAPETLPTGDDWLLLVEGEPDALRAFSCGVPAVAVPGVNGWKRQWAKRFAGRRVCVVFDCDEPGRTAAQRVAADIAATAADVRVLDLDRGRDDGYDLTDFLRPAVDQAGRDAARGLLLDCAEQAPRVARDDRPGAADAVADPGPLALRATPLSSIEMRSIEWYEKPLWQKSAFQLLAGAKGSGKGTYLAGLAARFSCGGMNVLFVSTEDSTAIDLKPRLVAAGADLDRCYVIQQHVQLPADVDALRNLALDHHPVGLLVIDPVANHIGDRDSNGEAHVRDAIAPLNKLADDLSCLLIGVRHPGKDRSRGALASILGSTAWVDTPRAVVMIAVDDDDQDVRVIQVVAGNRARNGSAQAFRIEAVEVPGLAEPITRAVDLGASTKSVDTLLAATKREPSRTAGARDLILDILDDEGEQESDTLDARVALETGLAAQTIKNARTALGKDGLLKSYPDKDETGAITCWKVYRTAAPRP